MRRRLLALPCFAAWLALSLAPLGAQFGDARSGAAVLKERRCIMCHSVGGVGGGSAPDLGKRSGRDFTPAALAAMMWNHGPAMWGEMSRQGVTVPQLTPEEVSDLYAHFFSLRYFDPAGDAARGKSVFVSKQCHRCHALVTADAGGTGPPVANWPSLADPIRWIQNMWNHGGEMAEELARDGIAWPQFTLQEMADLFVYLHNLPSLPPRQPTLRLGDPAAGEDVFQGQNCAECHTLGRQEAGKIDLAAVSRREGSLTGLAVTMWNHRPAMSAAARARGFELTPLERDQMAQLVAYLFEENFFDPSGNPGRGERVFRDKRCASCHGQPGSPAPELRGKENYSAASLASAVWRHGPAMLAEMRKQGIEWPTMSERDVVDVIAFLNRR